MGPVVHFVVLKSFTVIVNGHLNRYNEGKHYSARAGSQWDDLRRQIPDWERQKLVAIGLDAAAEVLPGTVPAGKIVGSGRATVGVKQ